jgi:hypothetical protein
MPRGKKPGRGDGPYAVMFEPPSDEDEGPAGRVVQYCETPEEAKELASRLNAMLRRTNPHWGGRKYGIYYVRQNKKELPWIRPGMFAMHDDAGESKDGEPKKIKRRGVCPRCRRYGAMCSSSRCHQCYLLDRREKAKQEAMV